MPIEVKVFPMEKPGTGRGPEGNAEKTANWLASLHQGIIDDGGEIISSFVRPDYVVEESWVLKDCIFVVANFPEQQA